MRAILVVWLWMTIACVPAQAQQLRPLSEVLGQEVSGTNTIYVMKRCAGVMLAVARRMQASGRDDVDQLVERSTDVATVFMLAASEAARQAGLNETSTSISNDVAAVADLYAEAMQRNYLATGNAIEGTVKEDISLCNSLGA